ncbi:hypothetical protein AMTR_s00068p00032890 [Amborella trichopoda]|uniref:Uncharacterized protein n=1 Tax=Amborella trichopoda TaxID=13333 RepID=U5D440_AMBTC|nr:hypothetical protein AMTR_s00068p00032890 [Amborella trichopoda]
MPFIVGRFKLCPGSCKEVAKSNLADNFVPVGSFKLCPGSCKEVAKNNLADNLVPLGSRFPMERNCLRKPLLREKASLDLWLLDLP